MIARLVMVATVIASSVLGVTSCTKKPESHVPAIARGERSLVGGIAPFQGASKPFRVPLDDSLAAIRDVPPVAPKFGESVYVTHLPTPVLRREPGYPASALAKGVSGKVLVQALVLTDGTVGETWIIQSIPGLDEAAARAVQRWTFTPALDGDKPVAVWVAVPVEFSAEAR